MESPDVVPVDSSSALLIESCAVPEESSEVVPVVLSDVVPVELSKAAQVEPSNVVQPQLPQETSCHSTKTAVLKSEELFFQSEALGTAVNPQCGACKCGKCPIPGSKYSYSEQKGWDIVQKNLRYDAAECRYYTVLPWLVPRSTLPENDKIA